MAFAAERSLQWFNWAKWTNLLRTDMKMAKKKAASLLPKLTEAEQDLLSHMQEGYSLKPIRSAATRSYGD